MITIVKYIVDARRSAVHVYYEEQVASAAGERTLEGYALLEVGAEKALSLDGWSNTQLAGALAAHLELAPTACRVAPPVPRPTPPARPDDAAVALAGETREAVTIEAGDVGTIEEVGTDE